MLNHDGNLSPTQNLASTGFTPQALTLIIQWLGFGGLLGFFNVLQFYIPSIHFELYIIPFNIKFYRYYIKRFLKLNW